MTHSAAMASEILPGKTILEALNTDLVCDAINTAMRELFLLGLELVRDLHPVLPDTSSVLHVNKSC